MNEHKEFEGKTIDDAINAACDHFNTQREKLEIEIISEGKGGIFGLVGVKKALIAARRRDNTVELKRIVVDVVEHLVKPIIDDPVIDVEVEAPGRVKVVIGGGENAGLLIGKEGQTLASLQYLVNRIVAKLHSEPLRIQLDTGDYRERQDDSLRQLAMHLAEKVKTQGRAQSTKPLSSYHRRVVHMTLQTDETVTTRSKGEGPLKRVLILPRRQGGHHRQGHSERSEHHSVALQDD